jgi:hypothetical protein
VQHVTSPKAARILEGAQVCRYRLAPFRSSFESAFLAQGQQDGDHLEVSGPEWPCDTWPLAFSARHPSLGDICLWPLVGRPAG